MMETVVVLPINLGNGSCERESSYKGLKERKGEGRRL